MLLEDAIKHVTGSAIYVNDMNIGENLLHGRIVYSPHAHAKIRNFDLKDASDVPGVFPFCATVISLEKTRWDP